MYRICLHFLWFSRIYPNKLLSYFEIDCNRGHSILAILHINLRLLNKFKIMGTQYPNHNMQRFFFAATGKDFQKNNFAYAFLYSVTG